jgi:geranylgeranyl diphosphate synthase type I
LFGSAAGIGAAIAGVDGKDLVCMQKFGRSGGMAFQIQDDVLDFHNGSGEQLLKGPNIVTSHCLHEAPRPNHNSDLLNSNNNLNNRQVLQLLRKTGSLEFARKRARDYAIEAKASLRRVKRLRNRRILEEYTDYLWKRKE